jgi:hypothetical protein
VFWAARSCGAAPNQPPGHVRMVDKAGGGVATIAEGCLLDLAGDATHVAWAGYTQVVAARLDGNDIGLVANSTVGIAYRVAPLGSIAYWGANGRISRYPIGGGPCTDGCERVADVAGLVVSLAADGTGTYYTTRASEVDDDGGLWVANGDAGSTTIAPARNAHTLAVTPDRLYYSDDDGIWGVRRDGGNRALVVSERAAGMAVHGDRLYWTNGPDVRTADIRGSDLHTLASGLVVPMGIAVDEAAVYWVERGTDPDHMDGRVVRLAR